MAYVRSSGYSLKDAEDDRAFQVVIGDLERLALNLYRGSVNSAYTLNQGAASNLNISSGAAPSIAVTNVAGGGSSVSQGFCSVKRTTSTAFVSQSDAIIFNTLVDDSTSAYNLTTGVFTAPVSGLYAINTNLGVIAATQLTDLILSNYTIFKNAVQICSVVHNIHVPASAFTPAPSVSLPFSQIMRLTAGDTLNATGGIATQQAPPNDFGTYNGFCSFFTASWIAT